MMPATYEPIATTTLGASASSITFSSIASTWTDLRLVLVATGTSGTVTGLRFNSDTATNYSNVYMYGNGSAPTSSVNNSDNRIYLGWDLLSTTIPFMFTCDIMRYAGSTNKTVLITSSEDKNGSGFVYRSVGMWRNTAAITSITLLSNFATGTTATLYGIKAA